MAEPVSSVDPSVEIDSILARLRTLTGDTFDGIDQDTELPVDGFGKKVPYRDFEPGSVIPAGTGRTLNGNEQQQPHIWAFQVHHYGPSRKKSRDLAIESDRSLLGWSPSSNASVISTFYFQMYDETVKAGENLGWVTTRFYECTLGVSPDFSLVIAP